MSAAALDNTGAALLGLCIGKTLVAKRTPPQLILEASKQTEAAHSAGKPTDIATLPLCSSRSSAVILYQMWNEWHGVPIPRVAVVSLFLPDQVTTVDLLQPLIHTLPHSLSPSRLLLYAALQAALRWKEDKPEVP